MKTLIAALLTAAISVTVLAAADTSSGIPPMQHGLPHTDRLPGVNCQNNLDILQSSGFVSTKTPVPVGPLPAPENLRSSYTGTSGEVNLRMTGVAGVTAGYTYQQADTVAGPFVTIATTAKTRLEVTGLTPAKTYWFQACANVANGPSGPCSAISVIAI
jgi:hypothetical protein